jgi:hypothetical protein
VLIVVVGIFFGLQVDAWNQDHKDRATETVYLDRLRADTTYNIAEVRHKAQSYYDRADSLKRIVEMLEKGTVDEIVESDLAQAFCYWYVPEGVRLQTATYDEMTTTGSLTLISSEDVRHKLQLALAENNRVSDEIPKLALVQMDLARSLTNLTKWKFDAPRQLIDNIDSLVPIQAGCVVDRVALQAEPAVSSVLVQLNRSQTIMGNVHSREKEALEELLRALDDTAVH